MLEESFSELELTRLEKLQKMKAKGIEPYPTQAKQTHTSKEAVEAFINAETDGKEDIINVTLAGRLRALRPMGKIAFAHIDDRAGRIQLFFRINDLGEEKMADLDAYYDLGDFIQASGHMFRTRRGEVTLHVEDFNHCQQPRMKSLTVKPSDMPRLATLRLATASAMLIWL